MVAVEPNLAPDPIEGLVARLDDPSVAAAVHQLVDHVDLLAILLVGLDGLVSRGDTIAEGLAEGIDELRSADRPQGLPELSGLLALLTQLRSSAGALGGALPALERLLRSDLLDAQVIDAASTVSRAIAAGARRAQAEQARTSGVRALLRLLRDDDVALALGFVVSIAKALGQELRRGAAAAPPS